jgi:membrane protein YdbS with pleckstrin-like domain
MVNLKLNNILQLALETPCKPQDFSSQIAFERQAFDMTTTREQFPLSTKKVLKKTIAGTIAWIIILLILLSIVFTVFIAFAGNTERGYVLIAGFVLLVLLVMIITLTYLYQWWYYKEYYYDLTANYVVIKKNPITPKEITIPYERIQDVYVDQDLLDRIFGLYDVHLSSATISSGMEAHIDGVEKAAADGLRSLLLQMVSQKLYRPQESVATQSNQPPSA